MRALFTVQPSVGHLHPLVPVATALRDAGHEVALCTSPSFRADVEAFGLPFLPAGLDWLAEDRSTWTAFPPVPPPGPEFARFVVTLFAEVTTAHMVPDLLRLAREWKPDLIVREAMEFSGCLVAEKLGIPHASVGSNGYAGVDSPDVGYFPGNRLLVAEAMAQHRSELGLPADPDVEMAYRYLHLCFAPPSWYGDEQPRPAHTRFVRHVNAVRTGDALPGWVAELDPSRPTVYASLGTVFNTTPGVLEAIIGGLREEPVNLVVTIGTDQDPERFGSLPSHVTVLPYLPQALLLPSCDVFVTHGGFNSVKESLTAGVPMVVLPITADQPFNAQRCAATGTGVVIEPTQRTPDAVRAGVREVLGNPSYRTAARRIQSELAALPGPDQLVRSLEALARHPAGALS